MKQKFFGTGRVLKLMVLTMLMLFLCGMSVAAETQTVTMPQQEPGMFRYEGRWPSDDMIVYHQFTVDRTSAVSVLGLKSLGSSTSGMYVTLCDSGQRPLDDRQYVQAGSSADTSKVADYALLKGTYYVRTEGTGTYNLVVMASSKGGGVNLKDAGGKTRARAKTIKAKKMNYGVIALGEKAGKADWFKFKVPKSKVLTFHLEAEGTSSVNFTLYGPSFPKGITMKDLKNQAGDIHTVRTRYGVTVGNLKVKTGTYYIRVTRSKYSRDKKNWAVYAIRWK